ncbi:uncharacterized protein LOC122498521 [Leptopilina heterotoma]|uniref:uncharacterized protein LOC122498521 n=1 Tax=Leptopilina heterotoma TaxID=63436 RepID=UPI001CA9F218|nr:uncharacterized protein LOC122498521 [Leptopilina heterotoma]
MSETNKKLPKNEFVPFLEDISSDDFNFPSDEDFLNNNDEHFFGLPLENVNSPKPGDQAPSPLFPTLAGTIDDDLSEFFYILNPISGVLEEAPKNVSADIESIVSEHHTNINCDKNMDVVPAKKMKRELTVYEETLLKNFSTEIAKEQQLLAAEHEKKMQLWDLEMQSSQQQHALKMAILKEQLEKIQQEKKQIEMPQNLKHLSKFKSGPI